MLFKRRNKQTQEQEPTKLTDQYYGSQLVVINEKTLARVVGFDRENDALKLEHFKFGKGSLPDFSDPDNIRPATRRERELGKAGVPEERTEPAERIAKPSSPP